MRVCFTVSARNEFLDALARLHRQDRDVAVRLRERVETVLNGLADDPDRGREMPATRSLDYLGTPYHFYYRIRNGILWILAVWDGGVPVDPG